MRKIGPWAFVCLIFGFVLSPRSSSAQFAVLDTFYGSNGANPLYVVPIQGTNGNIYGTTTYGGETGCPPPLGCGITYELSPSGVEKPLWKFTTDGTGGLPSAGLMQATDGNFYGTTTDGGANDCGTVFKMTPEGELTTVYNFDCESAGTPESTLVEGLDGDLYGNTPNALYRISPQGIVTIIYTFCPNCGSGFAATAGLILGFDGNFYGTTSAGNPNNGGTVFKFNPGGTLTTLYNFCSQPNCTDGSTPEAALVQAADGNFYGTTMNGGAHGYGTVFKITAAGQLTTLHSFDSKDGANPSSALVYASDGNFYGTTQYRGAHYDNGANMGGTVFKISPSGVLNTLHNFCAAPSCGDGENPWGGLLQDTNGDLYGETNYGGATNCVTLSGCGVIYTLSLGLPEFVKAQFDAGKVGGEVTILGTNVSGTTSVSFNGSEAAFRVVSSTEIKATVPEGASSGNIKVVLPNGEVSTNVPFRVLQ
jgi:uncharacterized repeat protein (TIGR03803 family)